MVQPNYLCAEGLDGRRSCRHYGKMGRQCKPEAHAGRNDQPGYYAFLGGVLMGIITALQWVYMALLGVMFLLYGYACFLYSKKQFKDAFFYSALALSVLIFRGILLTVMCFLLGVR